MNGPQLLDWLPSRTVRRTGRARTPRPRWRFVRPCLEVLEDRLAFATFTVINLNDSGDGSLRQAILDANITPGANTIDFQAGLTGTIKLNGALPIINSITIHGPAAGLTLDAQGKSGIFMVGDFGNDNDLSVALSGLTLTGGGGFLGGAILNLANLLLTNCTLADNSADFGGGIFNVFGTAELANCTLANNSADFDGGGIFNEFGRAELANCTLERNSAVDAGGGICNFDDAALALANCTLANNSADFDGGGIFNVFGTAELANCTLERNSAVEAGGGICNFDDAALALANCTLERNSAHFGGGIDNLSGAALVLANCTLANNSAFAGSGIFNNFGTAALANCTLAGNSADFAGGGIVNQFGTAALANCTLADNSASRDGGGILNAAGSMMLFNTIVADSTSGGDVFNEATLEGSNNLIEHGVGATDLFNPISGDPQLGPLQDNGGPTQTIAIPTSSAAFQAGLGLLSRLVTTDQRGLPRPPTPSLGAFEPQPSPPPSPSPSPPAPPPAQTSPSRFQAVHTLFINGAQLVLDARGFGPLLNLPAQSVILASIHINLPFAGIFGLPAVIAGANAANDALSGSSS